MAGRVQSHAAQAGFIISTESVGSGHGEDLHLMLLFLPRRLEHRCHHKEGLKHGITL